MPKKDLKPSMNKDDRAKALESNPCGICRSMGSPVCRGHGGGCGGSSNTAENKSLGMSDTPLTSPQNKLDVSKLIHELIQNNGWSLAEDADLQYEFDHPASLLHITLDMESGLFLFQGKPGATKEEQKEIDELFNAIKNEFDSFKKELMAKGISVDKMTCTEANNTLTLKIPQPKYYDAFLQRLLDKNLLPNKPEPVNDMKQSKGPAPEKQTVEPENTWKAPNPFDTRPKPRGWEE